MRKASPSMTRARATRAQNMSPVPRPVPSPPTSNSPDIAGIVRSSRQRPKRRKTGRHTYAGAQGAGTPTQPTIAAMQESELTEEKAAASEDSASSNSTPSTYSTIKVNGTTSEALANQVSPGTTSDSSKFHVTLHDYPMEHDPAGIALWVLHKTQSVREGVSETSKLKIGPRRSSQSLKRMTELAAGLIRQPLFQEGFAHTFVSSLDSTQATGWKVAELASKLVDVLPAVCDQHPSPRSQLASDALFDALNDSYYSTTIMEAFRAVAANPGVAEGMDYLLEQLNPAPAKVLKVNSHSTPKTGSPNPIRDQVTAATSTSTSSKKSRDQRQTSRKRKRMDEDVSNAIDEPGEAFGEIRSSRRERKPTAKALAAGIQILGTAPTDGTPPNVPSPVETIRAVRTSGRKSTIAEKAVNSFQDGGSVTDFPPIPAAVRVTTGKRRGGRTSPKTSTTPTTHASPPRLRDRPQREVSDMDTTSIPSIQSHAGATQSSRPRSREATLTYPGKPESVQTSNIVHGEVKLEQMLDNLFAEVAVAETFSDSDSDEDDESHEPEVEDHVNAIPHNDNGIDAMDSLDTAMITDSDSDEAVRLPLSHDQAVPATHVTVRAPVDHFQPPPRLPRTTTEGNMSRSFSHSDRDVASPRSGDDQIPRPYTDKDGWTMTGTYNAWGEELIELDRITWVTVPHKSTVTYPRDIPGPRRRYKTQDQVDDDRAIGFPPKAGQTNLPKDIRRSRGYENVNLEYQKFSARNAASKRGLKIDRSMSLQKLEELISDHDGTPYKPPAGFKEKGKTGLKIPGLNTTVIDFKREMAEKALEEEKRRNWLDSPDLNFQQLAKRKGPLVTQYAPLPSPAGSKIASNISEPLFSQFKKYTPVAVPIPNPAAAANGNLPILSPFGKLVATPAPVFDSNGILVKSQSYRAREEAARKRSAGSAGLNYQEPSPTGPNGQVTNGVFMPRGGHVFKRPRGPDPNFKVISTINLQPSTSSRQLPDFKRGGKIMKF